MGGLVLVIAAASSPAASAKNEAPANLPYWPDCDDHEACLCPWRHVLHTSDLQSLPVSLVPKKVVRCRAQAQCAWHVADQPAGAAIYHSRPDFRRDPLPIEGPAGADGPWNGRGTRYVARVADGWIVALNAGEFGAGLWWVARDGKGYKKLGEPHVVDLIATNSGLLAPTGLDHMVNGRGEVLLIDRDRKGVWRARRLARIGASAKAATVGLDGALLVVTRTELVRVTGRGEVTVLHKGRWDGWLDQSANSISPFYPGSVIVQSNGDILIGMRAAIVRLIPEGRRYREEWLAPEKCPGAQ